MRRQLGTLALVWSLTAITGAAMQAPPTVAIPPNATGLEGIPTISVTTTKDGVVRTELDPIAAVKNRLAIRIVDTYRLVFEPDGMAFFGTEMGSGLISVRSPGN